MRSTAVGARVSSGAMSRRPCTPSARWPFWLLVVAWLCANGPQAAVYATVAWLVEARSFSHQQDLTRSVAHLLKGERAAGRVALVLQRAEATAVPETSPVPAEAVLRGIVLGLESVPAFEAPAAPARRFALAELRLPPSWRAAPPLGPPRLG